MRICLQDNHSKPVDMVYVRDRALIHTCRNVISSMATVRLLSIQFSESCVKVWLGLRLPDAVLGSSKKGNAASRR